MAVSPWLTRLLPQGNFARGVSVLAGSTALAQGLAVAASPILTRLYTPDDFGLLAIFAAMLSVLAVIAGLRYELTIPLPEDDEDAAKLCVLAVMATVVVSILTALAVVVFGDQIAHSLGVPALAQWLWLLPVTLLFTGIYQALYYVAVRKNEYGTIGRTRFSRALVMLAIQFAAFRFGAVGLVFGHAAGWAAGPIDFVRLLRRKHRDMFRTAFDWTGIRAQALRYKSFPLWSSPGALLNTAGAQMPIIGFALLFSPAAAGLYALTQRVSASWSNPSPPNSCKSPSPQPLSSYSPAPHSSPSSSANNGAKPANSAAGWSPGSSSYSWLLP
jgi:O-antigen/teichoic acid export membrane protein